MHPTSWDPFRTTNNGRASKSNSKGNSSNNNINQSSDESDNNSSRISSYLSHHQHSIATTTAPPIIIPPNRSGIFPYFPAVSGQTHTLTATTTSATEAIPRDILLQNTAPRPPTDPALPICRSDLSEFSMERETTPEDEAANAGQGQETNVGIHRQQKEEEWGTADTSTACKPIDTANEATEGDIPNVNVNEEIVGDEIKKKRKRRPPAVPWKVCLSH
jgi:hypothetical protein